MALNFFLKRMLSLRLSKILTVVGILTALCPARTFAAPSVYLGQIAGLLPIDSTIAEVSADEPIGKKLDLILLRILQSPSGRIFCGAISDDVRLMKRNFFLSDRAADLGYEICKGQFRSNSRTIGFAKKYFIVRSVNYQINADGWTTPHNETFIFASGDQLDESRLTRTLIHELAISYDAKEAIGFQGVLDFSNLGLQINSSSCTTLSVLQNMKIKHTLSALRAFEMEKRISRELGLTLPEGFAQWDQFSCPDKLNFVGQYVQPFYKATLAEELVSQLLNVSSCKAAPEAINDFSLAADLLNQMTFDFADGHQQNACEYLSSGWPFEAGTSYHGGPGPRIGGGGWSSAKDFSKKDNFEKQVVRQKWNDTSSDSKQVLNDQEKADVEAIKLLKLKIQIKIIQERLDHAKK